MNTSSIIQSNALANVAAYFASTLSSRTDHVVQARRVLASILCSTAFLPSSEFSNKEISEALSLDYNLVRRVRSGPIGLGSFKSLSLRKVIPLLKPPHPSANMDPFICAFLLPNFKVRVQRKTFATKEPQLLLDIQNFWVANSTPSSTSRDIAHHHSTAKGAPFAL
jgi:hypothetical protein